MNWKAYTRICLQSNMFCDIELLLRKRYYAHRSCSDIEIDLSGVWSGSTVDIQTAADFVLHLCSMCTVWLFETGARAREQSDAGADDGKGVSAVWNYAGKYGCYQNTTLDIFPMRYHSMGNWYLALYNFLQKIFWSGKHGKKGNAVIGEMTEPDRFNLTRYHYQYH